MSFFCAQLDEANVCFCVAQLAKAVEASNIIPLETMDVGLLGKRYNPETKVFEEVAAPEPVEPVEREPKLSDILTEIREVKDRLAALEAKTEAAK